MPMEYPVPDPLDVEQVFTNSENASYIVYKKDGIIYADAQRSELSSFKGTDVATVINNAFDEIPNPAGEIGKGGMVFVKRGVYEVGSTISWGTRETLMGEGPFSTVFKLKDGANVDVLNPNGMGAQVINLKVDGNKANNSSGRGVFTGGYYAKADNLEILNTPEEGIWVGSNDGYVVNCRVHDSGSGYNNFCLGGSKNRIDRCTGWDPGNHNLQVVYGYGQQIVNSFFYGTVEVDWRCQIKINQPYALVSGCRIENVDNPNATGLGTNTAVITGNTFNLGNCWAAIAIETPYTSVIGNHIHVKENATVGRLINLDVGDVDVKNLPSFTGNSISIGSGGAINTFLRRVTGDIIIKNNEGLIGDGEERIARKTVNYNDASPVTVCNVENGYAITDVWVEVTTTWDGGASQNLQIGDGDDVDGFLCAINGTNNAIDLTTTGYYGIEHDMREAYLWDDTNAHARTKVYTGSDTIDATITPDGATQGQAIVYVKIVRIGG